MSSSSKAEKKPFRTEYDIDHIGVLDGIRGLAILVIVWFHFWQQCWLIPEIGPVSFDWIPRYGYLLVDMMILLSAFCLFLPHAKKMVYGDAIDKTSTFFVKRTSRILPSYYICIFLILFAFVIPEKQYDTAGALWKDFGPHLFMGQNWFKESYALTKFNTVLWTVAMEFQYYLIFPILAKCFRKKPVVTYVSMVAVGLIGSTLISINFANLYQDLFVNQAITFMGVYANGMLGAWAYVAMTKGRKKSREEGILFTMLAVGAIWVYRILTAHRGSYAQDRLWQVDYRFLLSLVFLLFIISVLLSADWFKKIFDNVVMKYIAMISYNLYIWHQYLAVKIKYDWKIPYWDGDTPPNQLDDKEWMWRYFIICIVVGLMVATFMTFCVEKPIAKFVLNKWKKHLAKKEEKEKLALKEEKKQEENLEEQE